MSAKSAKKELIGIVVEAHGEQQRNQLKDSHEAGSEEHSRETPEGADGVNEGVLQAHLHHSSGQGRKANLQLQSVPLPVTAAQIEEGHLRIGWQKRSRLRHFCELLLNFILCIATLSSTSSQATI